MSSFLEQYPNAKITTSLISQGAIAAQLEEIKKDCEDFQVGSYYKSVVTDQDSGTKLTVWINADNYNIACIVQEKSGVKTTVSTGETTTSVSATTTAAVLTCPSVPATLTLKYKQPQTISISGISHTFEMTGIQSGGGAAYLKIDGTEEFYLKGSTYKRESPPLTTHLKDMIYISQTDDTQNKIIIEISDTRCTATTTTAAPTTTTTIAPTTGQTTTIPGITIPPTTTTTPKLESYVDGVINTQYKIENMGTDGSNLLILASTSQTPRVKVRVLDTSGNLKRSFDAPDDVRAITFNSSAIILAGDDFNHGRLKAMDPLTGVISPSFSPYLGIVSGLGFDGSNVWYSYSATGPFCSNCNVTMTANITKLDKNTYAKIGQVNLSLMNVPGYQATLVYGFAWHNGNFFLTAQGMKKLYQFDSAFNFIKETELNTSGADITGIAFIGNYLYVAERISSGGSRAGKIYKFNAP